MKKIWMLCIVLLLFMVATGIVAAQTETTYYCYSDEGWRVCTPSEAIIAREAMTREIPRSLTQDEMNALLRSRQPYWDYYFQSPKNEIIPEPTLTPVPTPRPTQAPKGYWKSIIQSKYPARNYTMPFKLPATTGIPGSTFTSCTKDSQCVPAQCCHPTSCINVLYKPSCSKVACTMECSGPLDCGAGHCGCVKGKCQVIPGPGS